MRTEDYTIRIPREGGMLIDAIVFASRAIEVEDSAVRQLKDAAGLPTVEHALGMPDIHRGYGVPIGSVVATRDVVAPAAVGYDINCGMRLYLTSLHADEVDVKDLADKISREIPLGEGKSNVRLSKNEFELVLERGVSALLDLDGKGHRVWDLFDRDREKASLEKIEDRGSMDGDAAAVPPRAVERGLDQLATLGGGNHFIELQKLTDVYDRKTAERLGMFEGQLAVMIHSGSRGFGHEVGGQYMKKAGKYGKAPSKELAYLPMDKKDAGDYLSAMAAAANFAFANRALMGVLAMAAIRKKHPDMKHWLVYDVAHNIAKIEQHDGKDLVVHRKGGTRAFPKDLMKGTPFADLGQPVLIPGSMGTASYVLLGIESGKKSLYSVNHGAGRVMSRTAAGGSRRKGRKKSAGISDDEFERSMEGVYLVAGNRRAVKEEAPAAYKDIDEVIRTVTGAELALKVARLRPRGVLKG